MSGESETTSTAYGYQEVEYNYTPFALVHGVIGAMNFIMPSRAEKALQRIHDQRPLADASKFNLQLEMDNTSKLPKLALHYDL